MADVSPFVRYMLLCDNALDDPLQPNKPMIVGLISNIHAHRYPFRLDQLCVFLVLTEGLGTGEGLIRAVDAEDEERVFESLPHGIHFPADRLDVCGVRFRIARCPFPRPGLYYIQFLFDGQLMAQQPVLLR